MDRYAVTKFGVDKKYNEYRKLLWEGLAESKEDAISKALEALWDNEEDRDWCKPFLQASLYELN